MCVRRLPAYAYALSRRSFRQKAGRRKAGQRKSIRGTWPVVRGCLVLGKRQHWRVRGGSIRMHIRPVVMPLSALLLPHPAWRAWRFYCNHYKRAVRNERPKASPLFLVSSRPFPFSLSPISNNNTTSSLQTRQPRTFQTSSTPHSPKCTATIVPSAAPPLPAAPRPAARAALYVPPVHCDNDFIPACN